MLRGLLVWATLVAAAGGPGLSAQSRLSSEPHATLFGTVFNSAHLSMQGVRVVAYSKARPNKKYRAVTNYRGEYRIRVPAGKATFLVSASAPKFAKAQRAVEVLGIDKFTANLILERRKSRRSRTGAKRPD